MAHSIEAGWKNFREKVIPAGASEAQVNGMRHSFYGGAMVALSLSIRAAEFSEDVGTTIISELHDEITQWLVKVKEEVENAS
jgi:hypothetical protein